MEHNQNTIATLMIKTPSGSNFMTILDFSINRVKKLVVAWGHALVAVAFVENWQLQRGLNKKQFWTVHRDKDKWLLYCWELVVSWRFNCPLRPTAFKQNQMSYQLPTPKKLSNPSSVQQLLLCMFFEHK